MLIWSHRHLYKDTKQKSHRLSVKIPINHRFISERRIFSGETLKTSQSDSDSMRWRSSSITGPRMGTLFGASSRQSSLHSPSEITLTTSSLNIPVNVEKTTDSYPTVRLVTQPLKDHRTDTSSGSSGLSLPKSRWRSEVAPTTTEEPSRNLPEPVSTVALPPPGQGSYAFCRVIQRAEIEFDSDFTSVDHGDHSTFNAEELVESMDGIAMSISKQWVGLILLPAVSSIAGQPHSMLGRILTQQLSKSECVTAMNVSVKDQLGLSVSVAVGSAIVRYRAFTFMVTLGWILNKPLALLFDPFESIVLYISGK
ncbi:hypothetical protein J3R83DRAFT_12226 [Lanmaoa asiatica]|nr:hypothetical protein J3R83DRAFT_12226 [Lanmaoa asiatica]